MAGIGSYQGGSAFLRWWPKGLLAFAIWVLVATGNHSLQWATLLVGAAFVHGQWLPCQFTVFEEGVTLGFPFGRRRFLRKDALTIRMDVVGAFALVGPRRKFGYPLLDRILYEPGRSLLLRTAFTELGYELA